MLYYQLLSLVFVKIICKKDYSAFYPKNEHPRWPLNELVSSFDELHEWSIHSEVAVTSLKYLRDETSLKKLHSCLVDDNESPRV